MCRTRKKAVVAPVHLMSCHFPGKTEKKYESPSQDNWLSGRELKV